MKGRTSLTLSKEVLAEIDRIAGPKQSRSAFIEQVLAQYLSERAQAERDERELVLINRCADELIDELLEALEYQAPVEEFPEEER